MIELRRLQAFVAVAEEGHITRAADRLGMAQPPLSRMIAGLETELGVRLLQRLPRGVRLTDAGLALLEEARAVLQRAGTVTDAVRRAARGEQGRLAIGFTMSAAIHPLVPAAMRRFHTALPQVRVELDEAGTADLVDALLHGRLDAAFVRAPVGNLSALVVDHLLDEPMLVALPAAHPLAANPLDPVALSALASENFVFYRRETGPGMQDAIAAACHQAGFSPNVVQEARRLPATLSLVAVGLGISIVPFSMRRMGIDGVVYRPLSPEPKLVAPLHLALRRAGLPPTAQRFRREVSALLADFSPIASPPKPNTTTQ
jgi:DNA-binding transcriptional LysR family regulator